MIFLPSALFHVSLHNPNPFSKTLPTKLPQVSYHHSMHDKIINGSSTLKIYSVDGFGKLNSVWPALQESMDKSVDRGELLGRLLGCITAGLVLIVEKDNKFFGFSAVERVNDDEAVLHCLPVVPATVPCLYVIREWAKNQGVSCLKLVSHRLNGSNFRYIEKTLGFHREAMVFVQKIDLYG